jgi:hypothetical protein
MASEGGSAKAMRSASIGSLVQRTRTCTGQGESTSRTVATQCERVQTNSTSTGSIRGLLSKRGGMRVSAIMETDGATA